MRAALWIVVLGLLGGCRASTIEATRPPEAAAWPPASATSTVREESAKSRHVPTFAEEERAYHEALAIDARARPAFEALARLYYDRGVAGDAGYTRLAMEVVDQGERALAEVGQASAELAVIRGLVELGRGRPDRARTALIAALRADPAHGVAALNLARIELRLREPAAALEHLAIAARDPALALEARLSEGVARLLLGDVDGARAVYQAAQQLAPADPRPFYNLGRLEAALLGMPYNGLHRDAARRAVVPMERFLELAKGRPELAAEVAEVRAQIDTLNAQIELRQAWLAARTAEEQRQRERSRAWDEEERRRLLELERRALEAEAEAAAEQLF